MKLLLVLGCLALVASGLWLAWWVGGMQDKIDRHYIDRDES